MVYRRKEVDAYGNQSGLPACGQTGCGFAHTYRSVAEKPAQILGDDSGNDGFLPLSNALRQGYSRGISGDCSGAAHPGSSEDLGGAKMTGAQEQKLTVALAGNPNVGKSTLFNRLTGLHQHTGNWPGKTVGVARGTVQRSGVRFFLVDLPGTYTLEGSSEDERIAGEFVRSREADCTVVVCDASCLERSLILALQVLEQNVPTVICVNLIDEAKRRGICVNAEKLSELLSAPVVLTSAGQGIGIEELLRQIQLTAEQRPPMQSANWGDAISASEQIAAQCVSNSGQETEHFAQKVDRLLVSRRFGVPLMFLLLLGIVWLTVWGANYPSALLERLFDWIYGWLRVWLRGGPAWLSGLLVDGVYATCARVISVMLPPMAIFFPLFTVLEDVGYLPRMAFLLDPCMARCNGCGKQALTLCMGLGCNAVGVMGCRIIDSPRERVCAILTNAMVPCNGRFPTLILLGSLFFPQAGAAFVVAACVALGAAGAMAASGVLSKTVLRAEPSTFCMELPPFRRPRLGQILVRSLLDRTLFIAGRALYVAAPAGAILWLLSNTGLLTGISGVLEPFGQLLGMNGIILLGFVLSLPANELLIPVILMTITQADSLQAVPGASQTLLMQNMTWQMAVCTMVFTLFHWPCSTTLMTVYRETGSIRKTAAAFLLPTAVGCVLCIMLNLLI